MDNKLTDEIAQLTKDADNYHENYELKALTMRELIAKDIPEKDYLMAPWLTSSSTCLVHAETGKGKTWFTISVALHIALGLPYLKWEVPQPKKILYMDGEMGEKPFQQRLSQLSTHYFQQNPNLPLDNFNIWTFETDPDNFFNLMKEVDRERLYDYVVKNEIKILFLDNISTLFCGLDENDAKAWGPIQKWLLRFRKINCATVVVHHTGKNGTSRGSTKHLDITDAAIKLVADDSVKHCKFELKFEKNRGFFGQDAQNMELELLPHPEASHLLQWQEGSTPKSNYDQVVDYINAGETKETIAKLLNISLNAVYKHVRNAIAAEHIINSRLKKSYLKH